MESLLISSFPEEEYRPLDELRLFTRDKQCFYNHIILDGDNPVGFITYWMLSNFYYVEHFAMDKRYRNEGYGKETINQLCERIHPIVLEVEIPNNNLAQRRIEFYLRQGFILWNNFYVQPPYKPGNAAVPMYLMNYGKLNPANDFERVKEEIYREIYNIENLIEN